MIEICNISKRFGKFVCLDQVSLEVPDGIVYGLVGENGAGKSTLLRLIAGVYRADAGEIRIDGRRASCVAAKQEVFYMPDRQYYDRNATPLTVGHFCGNFYAGFSMEDYRGLLELFGLEENALLDSFSKGMKKQLSMLLGICANVPYLLCDETFDGLDPVMRQGIKSIFAQEIDERNLTLVIASHNLRELEDICDHIGILHRGGVLLEREVAELRCGIHRIQCVPSGDMGESFCEIFDVLKLVRRGKLVSMTVRGGEEEIARKMEELKPVYYEVLPLSLEEIFISETEVTGYDIKNLIL